MAAGLTDKFRKGAPFFQTTLSGSISDSDTSFTIASATGLPTDTAIDFVIDRIDQNGELLDPSLREVITGTVSGTTVTTDATRRGLDNTTAQAHTAGAVVEVNFTSDTWNDHIDGVLTSLNQDGTIKDDVVDSAQIADGAIDPAHLAASAVETAKIADSAVTVAKRSGGFKVGTFTITSGVTGSLAVTGVGFRPKYIEFEYILESTSNASSGRGWTDGTTSGSHYQFISSTVFRGAISSNAIFHIFSAGSTAISATLSSLDADGFTLNVGTAGETRTITYKAFG